MVVPINGLDMPPGADQAPEAVKDYYSLWWWVMVTLFTVSSLLRFCALDAYGAFISGLMGFLAYYLVRERCEKMSQCCVLYFGVLSATNGLFDCLPVLASMSGRTTETTTQQPGEGGAKVYTVTIEKHPFFDETQGDFYNYQSVVMLLSPVVMMLGAVVASKTYQAYDTSLFNDSDDEAARPFGQPLGIRTGPQRLGGGGGGTGTGSYGGSPYGRQAPNVPRFQGQGHRLGAG
eukprot:TRINITY_DN45775_c0_g1_i1.p1 TRINITY_DN45775_c0_g1~~TRINITY_DN45775_c0_g1_i1.p1  ORF type:complete len:233 (-),score=36.29 TRINITY_DN45775_c0_g1_i1:111-809(-)